MRGPSNADVIKEKQKKLAEEREVRKAATGLV